YSNPENWSSRAKSDPSQKIFTLDALAAQITAAKLAGARIVHAHGVFDLLHLGHIRHLHSARQHGDILVVTLTEDRHVNKGPGRPAFAEAQRAEAIAALEVVDYVAISRFPSAVEAITAIRPDVYIKGPDYRIKTDDVSGGIDREETAVRAVGGRLEVTDDVAFSSSALLNQYFPTFGPEIQRYLQGLKERYSSREILAHLARLAEMRIVVVGETILDEYAYVDQMGKSAKEPVLAMRYNHSETYPGGALAVANHLASFCSSIELVTYVGAVDAQENFIRRGLKANVRPNFVYKSASPTIVKRRYVEATLGTKLFEIYQINDAPLTEPEEGELCGLIEARLHNADAVVVADFGHGLLGKKSRDLLSSNGRFLAVNTQINAANVRYHAISNYARADYVCINEAEVRLDARDRVTALEPLIDDLSKRISCERFLVTRGSLGVEYFSPEGAFRSPSLAATVVDRMGAGDAVLAITSACVAANIPGDIVAFIANVVGAQKVKVVGNSAAVERVPTLKFIEALLK
ncbi:MAG: PfkB family carbohydrate kinase, partial [Vulcanimicrobiaceae bacterium]